MKTLVMLLMIGMLMGCSYLARVQVGEYGAVHSASVPSMGLNR